MLKFTPSNFFKFFNRSVPLQVTFGWGQGKEISKRIEKRKSIPIEYIWVSV